MTRISSVLFSAMLCAAMAGGALADTVRMKNGLEIVGKIHRETPEFVVLLVYDDAGRVTIPRDKIESIEYDFDSRLAEVDADDIPGLYKLALWAHEKGKYPETIQMMEALKGKEGIGPELYRVLGDAYEKREQFDKAYEAYLEHLKVNDDDEDLRKRTDELAKKYKLGPHNPANNPEADPKKPTDQPKIVDGLEEAHRWKAEKWHNSNPCTVKLYTDKANGNKMLQLVTEKGTQDKFALSGSGAKPLDLTESKEIIFKIYHNSKSPVRMAIAFQNGQGEFYETRQVRLAPNSWVNQTVPIAGKVFKSSRNNFNGFNDDLGGANNVTKIFFMIYEQREMTVYLDYIFFR